MKNAKRYVTCTTCNNSCSPKPNSYHDDLNIAIAEIDSYAERHEVFKGWVFDRQTKKRIHEIVKGF